MAKVDLWTGDVDDLSSVFFNDLDKTAIAVNRDLCHIWLVKYVSFST